MKKIVPILFLLYSGCAQAFQDKEFNSYVLSFNKTYKVNSFSVTILFVNSFEKSTQLGSCYQDIATIEISKYHWNKATEITKTNLIFHELGHCLFNRDHLDNKYPDGCPMSIMSTLLVDDHCFNSHADEMIKELDPRK